MSSEPDYEQYPDTGCEESPKCLTCPLPQCRFDNPVAYQLFRRRRSDAQRVLEIEKHNLSATEAADRFGVGERTVFRILARVRAERNGTTA